jgi:hypothetical protein
MGVRAHPRRVYDIQVQPSWPSRGSGRRVAGPVLTSALLGGCFSPAVAPGPDGTARAWTIQEPGDYLRILPGTPHAWDGVVAAIFLDSLVIVADDGTRQVHAFSVPPPYPGILSGSPPGACPRGPDEQG